MSLSRSQRLLRKLIKRFVYSQLYLRDSFLILLGRHKPLVHFTVEASPPSVYFNFALTSEGKRQIEAELDLPHPLAPIRCIEGEEPFHCLTLNVYRVSGLANGLRAEWSLYVREPSTGKPRYLVVEARADAFSMDPVAIFTGIGEVRHGLEGGSLSSEVVCADGSHFASVCHEPGAGQPIRATAEWVEANDFIYWLNGICDRTFYDAGLANARTTLIDPAKVEIEDTTRWAGKVEPTPRHVVLFGDAIQFAMSPWWNVDEVEAQDLP